MLFILMMAAGLLISASNIVSPVFEDKNPQADCIKGQNEAFIGKEQSGDAYRIFGVSFKVFRDYR
jgi:hypothetical protein